jgi:tripartite-type tricarboxylate transporter receptor subunit TctC
LSRYTVKKKLANIGAEAALSTPDQFKKLIVDEIARWRDVAKTAGLQPQ